MGNRILDQISQCHNTNPNPQNITNPKPKSTIDISLKEKQKRVMEKLREKLFARLAISNPTMTSTNELKKEIENRLLQILPEFHTPSHPTYAWMIYKAVVELNEKKGSTEESISRFIKAEYDDLPWAHASLLSHHLKNLCQKGEIVVTCNKCYKLPPVRPNPVVQRQKQKHYRGRHPKEAVLEEESKLHEQHIEVNDGEIEVTEEQRKSKGEQIEVIEKQDHSHDEHGEVVNKKCRPGEVEAFEEQNQTMGRHNELIEEQNRLGKPLEVVIEQDYLQEQQFYLSAKQSQAKEQHTKLIEEHNQAEQKIEISEEQNQLQEQKSQMSKDQQEEHQIEMIEEGDQVKENLSQWMTDIVQSCHGGDGDAGGGDALIVSNGEAPSPVMQKQRKKSLKKHKVHQQTDNPYAEKELVGQRNKEEVKGRIGTLLSSNDGDSDMRMPPDATAKPMERNKQKKLAEKVLNEEEIFIVCALRAEQKHQQQAGLHDQVKPPKLLPALMTAACELHMDQKQFQGQELELPNPKRPTDLELTALVRSTGKHHKRDKHCGPTLHHSQRKQFQPTLASPQCSQHFELAQQQKLPNVERPLDLKCKRMEESSETEEQQLQQQQQIEENLALLPATEIPAPMGSFGELPTDKQQFEGQELELLNPKRPQDLELMVLGIPTGRRRKRVKYCVQKIRRSQRKGFQPTLDSPPSPQYFELAQQQKLPNEERYLDLNRKRMEESSETEEQQQQQWQQTEEKLSQRQLRPRGQGPSKLEPGTAIAMEPVLALLPPHNLYDQLQEPGKSPEPEPDMNMNLSVVRLNRHEHQQRKQQRQGRGRGRPPKSETTTVKTMEVLSPSKQKAIRSPNEESSLDLKRKRMEESSATEEKQQQQWQQIEEKFPRRQLRPRGQGPSKLELATAIAMEQLPLALLPARNLHDPLQEPGKSPQPEPELEPDMDMNLGALRVSIRVHPHERQQRKQQSQGSGRGRPPKLKPDDGTQMGVVLQKPKHKRRGRPPKLKPDDGMQTEVVLQRPKHKRRGRPSKLN